MSVNLFICQKKNEKSKFHIVTRILLCKTPFKLREDHLVGQRQRKAKRSTSCHQKKVTTMILLHHARSKPRKIRKLVWEKSKLKNLKAELDEAYMKRLSERQRRTSARFSEENRRASVRPFPTNGLLWAIRRE